MANCPKCNAAMEHLELRQEYICLLCGETIKELSEEQKVALEAVEADIQAQAESQNQAEQEAEEQYYADKARDEAEAQAESDAQAAEAEANAQYEDPVDGYEP